MTNEPGDDRPALRIVKGEPTEQELAALVTVVAARTTGGVESEGEQQPRSAWGDPAHAVRPVPRHGPDGWRRSAFPR